MTETRLATTSPQPESPRRRRRVLQPRAVAAIALSWVLLWDRVTWGNIVNGVLVGLVVTYAFPLPSIEFEGRLRPHRLAWLIVRFVADLFVASWQVMLLAFGTKQPRNAVIEVQLRSRSDFYLTITAELVALVPGSVVVDARRSTSVLYLHLLDVHDPAAIEAQRVHVLAIERRVVRTFGSREEIESLETGSAWPTPPATDRPESQSRSQRHEGADDTTGETPAHDHDSREEQP
ncbi:Na+/H+ antiporter subunit E [Terrabacter sp. 2RAF25]|uniref:Na+/H+ antiporter subunit E n=1 Tax=Terrabacter sp. 2RAF25 TaxID=3232998 RepID=UPI003F99A43F